MEDYFSEILPTVSPNRSQRIRNGFGDIGSTPIDSNVDRDHTNTKDAIDSKQSFNIAGIFKRSNIQVRIILLTC